MDEPLPEQAEKAAKRQTKKQRALNALIFLLAVAVCVQAFVVWEMNARLDAAFSELDAVKQIADNAEWKVIPRPKDPDDSSGQSNDPQSQPMLPSPLDPLAQLGSPGWDPFSDMERMRQEMDRLMGRMQPRANIAPQVGGVSRNFGGPGQMSVNNLGDSYVIKAYLPDVDAADVSVRVENQRLTICVKQEQSSENLQSGGAAGQMRTSGSITNQFTLPEAVDGARITKTFKDNVLTVTIPKTGRASKGSNSDPSESVRN